MAKGGNPQSLLSPKGISVRKPESYERKAAIDVATVYCDTTGEFSRGVPVSFGTPMTHKTFLRKRSST